MAFRVGILGCGLMGVFHARVLAAMPDVVVPAVCNRTPEKAQRLAGELGARWHTDQDAFLREELDAVYVCTPDFAHREPAIAVLDAGKHLFLEKALATTIEDGRAILRAAQAHPELKAMVGYPARFDPRYQRMKELVSSEEAGQPAMAWSLRAHFISKHEPVHDPARDEYYRPPDWYWAESQGRGPIFSHGSHDYDRLMWFFGPIERVFAYGGSFLMDGPGDVADAFTVALRFQNGAVGTVSTPWVTRVEYDCVGVATTGLTVVNADGEVRIKRAEGAEERVTFEEPRIRSRWPAMHRHFIRCVREDRQPLVSVADGLNAIVVADAAHRSLKEGREIAVEA